MLSLRPVAALRPDKEKTKKKTTTTTVWDLSALIDRYALAVSKVKPWDDDSGVLYELEVCPFNVDHVRSSSLMQFANGAVAFSCVSRFLCKDHDWVALRGRLAQRPAIAWLRTLSLDKVKATWLSFVEDLTAVGVQALIVEVNRLTGIGINMLKQAVTEHRAEARRAESAERKAESAW